MSTVSSPSQPATSETQAAPRRNGGPPPPTRPSRSGEGEFGGEARIAIRGVTWKFYEHFVDGIPEGSGVRTAFDGKDLEIMTTGNIHEYFKKLIGRFVDILCEELNIQAGSFGETTWKRPKVERGIEADECYYFDPEKLGMARLAVSRLSNDVVDYPNPDLAIEIDFSRSQVDRPGIYAALGVREVWRFNGHALAIETLTEDGMYKLAERGEFLHIRSEEALKWILDPAAWDRVSWSLRLRAWARAELAPRIELRQVDPATPRETESA